MVPQKALSRSVPSLPSIVRAPIEVLSPGTRSYDRTMKRKVYFDAGVPEVWLLDIDGRSVEVWRFGSQRSERVEEVLRWHVHLRRPNVGQHAAAGDATLRLRTRAEAATTGGEE